MIVRMKLLYCLRAAILLILLTSAVSHAFADSQKIMQAQVQLNISWNINEGDTNRKGSLLMQISGTLELNPLSVQTPGGKAITRYRSVLRRRFGWFLQLSGGGYREAKA